MPAGRACFPNTLRIQRAAIWARLRMDRIALVEGYHHANGNYCSNCTGRVCRDIVGRCASTTPTC